MTEYVVCALYKFVTLEDYKELQAPLLEAMNENGIKGTLLVAREGINGTIAGTRAGIDGLMAWLEKDGRFDGMSRKESYDEEIPFYRTKVKLKKEIVTMGIPSVDPTHIVGTYVKPTEWNALISDPDVILIDTRNRYEMKVGSFQNAIDPEIDTFREFPEDSG